MKITTGINGNDVETEFSSTPSVSCENTKRKIRQFLAEHDISCCVFFMILDYNELKTNLATARKSSKANSHFIIMTRCSL